MIISVVQILIVKGMRLPLLTHKLNTYKQNTVP